MMEGGSLRSSGSSGSIFAAPTQQTQQYTQTTQLQQQHAPGPTLHATGGAAAAAAAAVAGGDSGTRPQCQKKYAHLRAFLMCAATALKYAQPALTAQRSDVAKLLALLIRPLHDNDCDDNSDQQQRERQREETTVALEAAELLVRLATRRGRWFAELRIAGEIEDADADGEGFLEGGGAGGGGGGGEIHVSAALKALDEAGAVVRVTGRDVAEMVANTTLSGGGDRKRRTRESRTGDGGAQVEAAAPLPLHVHNPCLAAVFKCAKIQDLRDVARHIARADRIDEAHDEQQQAMPVTRAACEAFIVQSNNQSGNQESSSLEAAWDMYVGTCCSVEEVPRQAVEAVMRAFHAASGFIPPMGGGGMVSTPPFPTSDAFVLKCLASPAVHLPAGIVVCQQQQQHDNDGGDGSGDIVGGVPVPLLTQTAPNFAVFSHQRQCAETMGAFVAHPFDLFASRDAFDSFIGAKRLQMEIFEVTELRRDREMQRDAAFLDTVADRVEVALSGAMAIMDLDIAAAIEQRRRTSNQRRHRGSKNENENLLPQSWLELALDEGPLAAAHLWHYSCVWQWLRCAERLVEFLEFSKRYTAACTWLRRILTTPILRLGNNTVDQSSPNSPSDWLVEVPYRYDKRGHFVHRLLVDLTHCKQHREALAAAEHYCLGRDGGDSDATPPPPGPDRATSGSGRKDELEGDEEELKRRRQAAALRARKVRMLHVLWPSNSGVGGGTGGIAEETLAALSSMRCFMRRAHRVSCERVWRRLHAPPRRWNPIRANAMITPTLRSAREFNLHAKRDQTMRQLWVSTHASSSSGRSSATNAPVGVEDFVLNWFVKGGRGRREQGWRGAHCEGEWFSSMFDILLRPVLLAPPAATASSTETKGDGDGENGNGNGTLSEQPSRSTGLGESPFYFLTPFQPRPLDASTPGTHFGLMRPGSARRAAVEEELDRVARMSRSEFVALVMERCSSGGSTTRGGAPPLSEATAAAGASAPAGGDDIAHAAAHHRDAVGDAAAAGGTSMRGVGEGSAVQSQPIAVDVASCVPIKPLVRLLRTFLLAPPCDGHVLKSSGFPDLAVWRQRQHTAPDVDDDDSNDGDGSGGGEFLLVEVKSPSDSLSDKQVAVNDTLIRSGFDVSVCRVIEVTRSAADDQIVAVDETQPTNPLTRRASTNSNTGGTSGAVPAAAAPAGGGGRRKIGTTSGATQLQQQSAMTVGGQRVRVGGVTKRQRARIAEGTSALRPVVLQSPDKSQEKGIRRDSDGK